MVSETLATPLNGQKASPVKESRLLEYLPPVFREDPMMGQFLRIFEDILNPLENTVDNLALYFDPRLTPESVLPWLASWLDLALDPAWPLERRRELVKNAPELYRWRGTKRGLSDYLRIYTGKQPQIVEYIPGMILDEKTRLGMNSVLGSSGAGHHFTVIIELDRSLKIDPKIIKDIIESQKPAHTVYTLVIR